MTHFEQMLAANFISFGVPFRIECNDDFLFEEMLRVIPHQSNAMTGGVLDSTFQITIRDGHYIHHTNSGEPVTTGDRQFALDCLKEALMVHVAEHAPDYVFVHAGVVSCDNRAILLPGRSHAGKTTLVAELVKAGATYYSDEYAVVDSDGKVHPYARHLQMRTPGLPGQRSVAVESIGGLSGNVSLPVENVFFVQYVAGADFSLEPISNGSAIFEMLRHAIPVRRTPARVMSILARMMDAASAWRGDRGEAPIAAKAILNLCMESGEDG